MLEPGLQVNSKNGQDQKEQIEKKMLRPGQIPDNSPAGAWSGGGKKKYIAYIEREQYHKGQRTQ